MTQLSLSLEYVTPLATFSIDVPRHAASGMFGYVILNAKGERATAEFGERAASLFYGFPSDRAAYGAAIEVLIGQDAPPAPCEHMFAQDQDSYDVHCLNCGSRP